MTLAGGGSRETPGISDATESYCLHERKMSETDHNIFTSIFSTLSYTLAAIVFSISSPYKSEASWYSNLKIFKNTEYKKEKKIYRLELYTKRRKY
jgi:hypothetical protein